MQQQQRQDTKSGFSPPCSVFQIIPWNWKHLTNPKVEGKSFDTWYYIVTCATLCLSFSSKWKAINLFPNHILKSKGRDQSNQARKKLICHVKVKNYLSNVSWKFLIKIESTRRREIKEQPPQLALLYCGRTVRSSHRRCCIRKLFLKMLQYPQEAPVLESIFQNLQTFRPATLLKRDPNTGVFLWILQNVWYYIFWKTSANYGCSFPAKLSWKKNFFWKKYCGFYKIYMICRKKTFFTEKNINEKIKNIYLISEINFYTENVWFTNKIYKSFSNTYSFYKKKKNWS